jgi:hypothetical protein
MGFYSDIILPRLCDLAMRNKQLLPFRERVIGSAEGSVLEIATSGNNSEIVRKDFVNIAWLLAIVEVHYVRLFQ